MEKEPLDIKIEPFNLNDKCAEVYRNNSLGTYNFLCYACGETLDSTAADSIFKHLDTHYYFEGQNDCQETTENEQEDGVNPVVIPFQAVFLDDNVPIDEEECSAVQAAAATSSLGNIVSEISLNSIVSKPDLTIHLHEHNSNILAESIIKTDADGISNDDKQDISGRTNDDDNAADQNSEFKCQECDKVFANKSSLKGHYLLHSEKRQIFECDRCDKTYISKTGLRTHRQQQHSAKRNTRHYTCNICNDTFRIKQIFVDHLRITHSVLFEYKCDICGKVFKRNSRLVMHKTVHDPPKRLTHACNVCGKKFMNSTNVMIHMRIHTGEKPFECSICQKRFTQSAELTTHVRRIHTGEKKYQCEQCGKEFFTASALGNHTKVSHTKEKPFKCQFCDASFNFSTKKNDHERIHTGEKPYKCKVCNCSFRTSKGLRQHTILHTGDKPYKCKYCDLKFAQTAGRRGHEKSKHGAF